MLLVAPLAYADTSAQETAAADTQQAASSVILSEAKDLTENQQVADEISRSGLAASTLDDVGGAMAATRNDVGGAAALDRDDVGGAAALDRDDVGGAQAASADSQKSQATGAGAPSSQPSLTSSRAQARDLPNSEDQQPASSVISSEAKGLAESQQADAALEVQASTGYDSSHVNMYRLYNPNSGEHFYTGDVEEATSVACAGWRWEGIGWVSPIKTSKPVYRLYNPNAGDHHYTLDSKERDNLVSEGWNYEGIGWYSDGEDQIVVYRQYNPNAVAGAHNFTTDVSEDAYLGEVGWMREGRSWYATDGPIVTFQARWLVTDAWGSLERYWIDSTGNIALDRIIWADEGAGYTAYATESGAVVRGKQDRGDGYVYVADNDGRLAATASGADGWLVTDVYDGGMQRYYYVASEHAMRSGFFEIDGFRYFGVGDQGYVLRGTRTWGDHMLLADNDGHMATGTGWLETSLYDGSQNRKYYLEYVWSDYSGARLGLFSIDGVYYYGVSDGGYVGESAATSWVNGWWYSLQDGQLIEVDPEMHQRVNRFVENMKAMAADDSHGYDQEYRWGEYGDYDCSSLVITCLKQAGFDTGTATYTGDMRSNLVARGWEWRSEYGENEMQAGVIFLSERHHTAAMISTTQIAQASINENDGITGGKPGDQTGYEITIRDYYDYPWDGVLVPTPWCTLA